MSNFQKAMFITAGIIVGLSAVSTVAAVVGRVNRSYNGIDLALWYIALAILISAVIIAIIMAITGHRRVAAGIMAGAGLGVVALGVSCFADLTIQPLTI